jgi:hypothetical protein
MEKAIESRKKRPSSFKQIVSSWADYIIPDKNERDPEFRNYLGRLSRTGLLVAGILAIVGVVLLVSIYLLLGWKLAWINKPGVSNALPMVYTIIILIIGVVCMALSKVHRGPQWGRLVVFTLILIVCVTSVWEDVVRGDISFSAAYLMLFVLIGAGAMPFRPWQVLVLGAIITISFYSSLHFFPIPEGIEAVVPKANSLPWLPFYSLSSQGRSTEAVFFCIGRINRKSCYGSLLLSLPANSTRLTSNCARLKIN